ncbi:hypothetical protein O3P69_005099 [Scylla paramamosain]|uniref:Uncharacterized protein n=1 Tax=Scylla paramamosain TaxID=85552 RepID=A0AAW0U9X0_SCYPA
MKLQTITRGRTCRNNLAKTLSTPDLPQDSPRCWRTTSLPHLFLASVAMCVHLELRNSFLFGTHAEAGRSQVALLTIRSLEWISCRRAITDERKERPIRETLGPTIVRDCNITINSHTSSARHKKSSRSSLDKQETEDKYGRDSRADWPEAFLEPAARFTLPCFEPLPRELENSFRFSELVNQKVESDHLEFLYYYFPGVRLA